MTAFHHFERQMRAAVRRAHGPARRAWRRPALLGLVAALTLTGAALAATGTIRIGPVHDSQDPLKRSPHAGAGVRAGKADTLALRVADPAGGPPWTLRVFRSSRGAHCVQVGQVVRGHFGVFVAPDTLEPLRAWPGGTSSLCSGQARDDFPVVRGLQRVRVVGGIGDPKRCPGRPYQDCPITSVTLLRYGLLGPGARRVRLEDAGGHTIAAMRTRPVIGGAYLFAVEQDVAPHVDANRALRDVDAAVRRAARAARAAGTSVRAAVGRVQRGAGARARAARAIRPPDVRVVATFSGGRALRVAGTDRSHAELPGLGGAIGTRPAAIPFHLPVRVRVTDRGAYTRVALRFEAPLRIARFDRHYTAVVRGRRGAGCRLTTAANLVTTRDVAAGEIVRLTLHRLRDRDGWCTRRFDGELRYNVPGRVTTIGRFGFTIP